MVVTVAIWPWMDESWLRRSVGEETVPVGGTGRPLGRGRSVIEIGGRAGKPAAVGRPSSEQAILLEHWFRNCQG